jgi:hypothetical protein
MQHKCQRPTWWQAWLPLLVLGGLLVLEHQAPLSPGGHQVAEIALALLMYGVVVCWLRRNRGALVNEAYEREQAQEHTPTARQQRQEPVLSDDAPWDDVQLPWHRNGHDTDPQRR